MTVAQLQATLGNFDPTAEVVFGYPVLDNYGAQHQERSANITIDELVESGTGTVLPVIFIDGAQLLEV